MIIDSNWEGFVVWRSALISVCVLLVSACATNVRTQVDAYSAIADSASVKPIYIAAFSGQDSGSLQWKTNAGVIKAVLEGKGFSVVTSRSEAGIIAYAGFGIDRGEAVTTNYSIPQYGVTGYSASQTTGYVMGNTLTANTVYTPTYGVTGYSMGTRTDVIYTRSFALDMVDKASGQKIFEGRSVSKGSCGSFSSVAKPIIQATLSNFPGGKVGSVTLPMEGEC